MPIICTVIAPGKRIWTTLETSNEAYAFGSLYASTSPDQIMEEDLFKVCFSLISDRPFIYVNNKTHRIVFYCETSKSAASFTEEFGIMMSREEALRRISVSHLLHEVLLEDELKTRQVVGAPTS